MVRLGPHESCRDRQCGREGGDDEHGGATTGDGEERAGDRWTGDHPEVAVAAEPAEAPPDTAGLAP